MVVIAGLWQLKQGLQHDVNIGRFKEIGPSGDQRDALRRVINHDRKMVGRAHVPPRKDHVTDGANELVRGSGDLAGFPRRAVPVLGKSKQRTLNSSQGLSHIKPQGTILARVTGITTGSGIDEAVGADGRFRALLRGRCGSGDVAAVAGARIEQAVGP